MRVGESERVRAKRICMHVCVCLSWQGLVVMYVCVRMCVSSVCVCVLVLCMYVCEWCECMRVGKSDRVRAKRICMHACVCVRCVHACVIIICVSSV